MPFEYTHRIYDVLCAIQTGAPTTRFDPRFVDAAHAMIDDRGSVASALLYCSCLLV
jgi:hypothetical protein